MFGQGTEKELEEAIEASRESAFLNEINEASLTRVLELSKAAEEEEAELKLALEASLNDAKQKVLGLGLKADSLPASKIPNFSYPAVQTSDIQRIIPATPAIAEKVEAASSRVNNSAEVRPVAVASARILKVNFRHDTRRLRSHWGSDAKPQEVFESIQRSIEEGFGLPKGSLAAPMYVLKYLDDEGDHCTLVEETLRDFLDTMALQGTSLRITLEEQPHDSVSPDSPGVAGFTIATPPTTPRNGFQDECSQDIEEDYEAMWSIVEAQPSEE